VYADLGFGPADLPATEEAYAGLISLPIFPTLSDAAVDRVIGVLGDLLS
jgi:dTDP-4-amino-4,6-dideoxygalactose transaminase